MKIIPSIIFCLLFLIHSKAQRVLIIGIDGCRANVAEIANTPYLDEFKANGLYSPDALNNDITISGPAWSAILCGVWSNKHLVTGNNFSGNNYAEYPSIFHRIEQHDANLNTVSICHWNPINSSIVLDDADTKINVTSDLAVAMEAIAQLDNHDPHALFLHFDDIDHAGHAHGFAADVPEYVAAIESVDEHLGAIKKALELRPNYTAENWVVLITSDHGGINFSHGGNSDEEENVLFIASGDAIGQELITKDSSYVLDEAFNCFGDTTELSFDGDGDYVEILHDPLFDFGTDQDFTIECRVRTTEAADVAIIGNKDWDSGSNKGFVISFKYASGPEWKVNIGDGSNRADINTGGSIADGEWHTLSVSCDRDGMMKMYEDGSYVDQIDISSIGNMTNTSNLVFGADIDLEYEYSGSIAEVRVWNGIVSAQAISDYQCNPIDEIHPNYADLLGYWKLNSGTGNLILDLTTNGNDGIVTGAEWYTPDSIWTYDYSATPKIVDLSISALGHMCIPIDPTWNLDGNSWINDCIYNDPNCVNPGYNTWIGPSIGLWNDASNWSRQFSPLSCDNVIIPAGNNIQILSGEQEECNSLTVEDGSELNIATGGSLNIIDE